MYPVRSVHDVSGLYLTGTVAGPVTGYGIPGHVLR